MYTYTLVFVNFYLSATAIYVYNKSLRMLFLESFTWPELWLYKTNNQPI